MGCGAQRAPGLGRKEKMKKQITQKKLEDMWAKLNSWQTPEELKEKQKLCENRFALTKNQNIAKQAWLWGMFDILSLLLTRKEQLRGWNRWVKSKKLETRPKRKPNRNDRTLLNGGSPERKEK